MDAFLTGSRAYGTPKEDSDIDLVVLVTPEEATVLLSLSDNKAGEAKAGYLAHTGKFGSPCKYGKLNLLICTNETQMNGWRKGTEHLKAIKPVLRETAVKVFDDIRDALPGAT